jgi:hypothetical protein
VALSSGGIVIDGGGPARPYGSDAAGYPPAGSHGSRPGGTRKGNPRRLKTVRRRQDFGLKRHSQSFFVDFPRPT